MTELIGLPRALGPDGGPLAQARLETWRRLRWAALALEAAGFAARTDAPAAATTAWADALDLVDDLARAADALSRGPHCGRVVARAPDGRLYPCSHPEAFHVEGLCLGCANIVAVEPDCGSVTGPPTWQVAHRFQDDEETAR